MNTVFLYFSDLSVGVAADAGKFLFVTLTLHLKAVTGGRHVNRVAYGFHLYAGLAFLPAEGSAGRQAMEALRWYLQFHRRQRHRYVYHLSDFFQQDAVRDRPGAFGHFLRTSATRNGQGNQHNACKC